MALESLRWREKPRSVVAHGQTHPQRIHQLRNAEVDQLRSAQRINEDVGGLDVSMKDPASVSVSESFEDRAQILLGEVIPSGWPPRQVIRQALFYPLQYHEV